jgi:hypothetical protein
MELVLQRSETFKVIQELDTSQELQASMLLMCQSMEVEEASAVE